MIKKIIILTIPLLLLCGCDSLYEEVSQKGGCLQTFCDEKYGIEYIRDVCERRGGLSVRYNEKDEIIHCKIKNK